MELNKRWPNWINSRGIPLVPPPPIQYNQSRNIGRSLTQMKLLLFSVSTCEKAALVISYRAYTHLYSPLVQTASHPLSRLIETRLCKKRGRQ